MRAREAGGDGGREGLQFTERAAQSAPYVCTAW